MQKLSAYTAKKWIYFLLILLSFVLYGNTIQNDYGFDDFLVVTENPYVQKGIAGIPEISEKPYAVGKSAVLDRRPITLITFALEHQFFGNNPHVSHFINVLLFSICLILICFVLTNIFHLDEVHPFLPFIITAFFAAHPIHTEVVNSLKNRDEILVMIFGMLFILLGSYYHTKIKRRWLYLVAAVLVMLFMLFSKITGMVFVAIFILIWLFYAYFKSESNESLNFTEIKNELFNTYINTKTRKRLFYLSVAVVFILFVSKPKVVGIIIISLFVLMGFYNAVLRRKIWNYTFVITVLFFAVRAALRATDSLKRTTAFFENPLEQNKDFFIALGTAGNIILYHLKMLFYPAPLRFYYGYNMFPLVSITNKTALISVVLHVSLLIYGVIRFYKKDNLGFFILCYFVSIFLYANFPIPYTGMFSERALFLSSLWFIVILAIIIVRLSKLKISFFQNATVQKSFFFLLTCLFVFYSYATVSRNFLWKNNLTLMSHDIEHLENSVLANFIYANNLKSESKKSSDKTQAKYIANKATYYYQKAISLAPNYPEFYFKLASTYRYNLQNLDSAERYFGYAISIDSLYRDANYELSKLFFDKQEFGKSYYFFGKTYAIEPTDSLTLFYYAQSAANVGDMATCYKINLEFLKLYPNLQYPYLNLGTYYSTIKKDDSAVIYFEKAVTLGARNPQLLRQMSIYFKNKNDIAKSDYYLNLLQKQ